MNNAALLRLIESAHEKGHDHWAALPLNQSERIMLAFAFMDRRFLPQQIAKEDSRILRDALNENERWAIAFWLDNSLRNT